MVIRDIKLENLMTEKIDIKIEELAKVLKDSDNIVFFGGAGVSTESDIPDFRSAKGLWNEKLNINCTPEQLVSHTFYIKYPKEFFEFYKSKLIYPNAKPNKAHITLAKLEKNGKLKAVITQNIDGLHQAAGSKIVYELHGSVVRNFCEKCNFFYDEKYILNSFGIPKCEKCGGRIKPDVVLYEEALDNNIVSKAVDAISRAEVLIIGGTSLMVYPAAGLIQYFRGKKLILINKTETSADKNADIVIHGSIGEVLDKAFSLM